MKKYVLTIALVALTSCTSIDDKKPVPNYQKAVVDESVYNELDQLYLAGNVKGVFAKFQSIDNPNTLLSASYWIRDVTKQSDDSRYMYLYATTLLRMLDIKNIDKHSKEEFAETAALSFYAGRYIMLIDAERCQEEISRMALLMNMELEIEEEILKIMNNFSKEKQEKIGQMALQIEENKKKRKKQGWICKQSREYLSRYRAQDPDCNDCTIQKNGKITNIIFPEKSNLIKYKSDKDWLQKRNEMRNALSGTKN